MAETVTVSFADLPLSLLTAILSFLPVDDKGRLACVARAWSAAASNPSLWTSLDLSVHAGVASAVLNRALHSEDGSLLEELAARAGGGGGQQSLNVSGFMGNWYSMDEPAQESDEFLVLRDFVSTTPSLRSLVCTSTLGSPEVAALLPAAPQLATFTVAVKSEEMDEAEALLRASPPFDNLRVTKLELDVRAPSEAAMLSVLAAAAGCASLRKLALSPSSVMPPRALAALVDAAVAGPLTAVTIHHALLGPDSLPALTRLVRDDPALVKLDIRSGRKLLPPAAGGGDAVPAFWAALRGSPALCTLRLADVGLWDSPASVAGFALLAGHPTLRKVAFDFNMLGGRPQAAAAATAPGAAAAAGAALGALVAGDGLASLSVFACYLGDAGLEPLFALPAAPRLAELCVWANGLSAEFARGVAAPAVTSHGAVRAGGRDFVVVNGLDGADQELARALGQNDEEMDFVFVF